MYNNKSRIYITSFVAMIETVLPDNPALAVLPDLWMNIFGFGGKSYWMTQFLIINNTTEGTSSPLLAKSVTTKIFVLPDLNLF